MSLPSTPRSRDVRRRVPDPAPFRDALRGATALVHRLTLVTRNIKDFARFDGLDIIDPWHPQGPTRDVIVRGHEILPAGGQWNSPVVDMESPHWWT
jgi:hypothetical protein